MPAIESRETPKRPGRKGGSEHALLQTSNWPVEKQEVLVPGVAHSSPPGNEPVLGIRARTLPYAQAIGRAAPGDEGGSVAAALSKLVLGDRAAETGAAPSLGSAPARRRYTFGDLGFTLPGLALQDDVVVAFGTRTVLRVPLGAAAVASAPLDFDVLGSVRVPLWKLVNCPQPVELLVPVRLSGEALEQVARASLKQQKLS